MTALQQNVTVAVIGAGTMGAGVAQVAAAAGHPTLLFDQNPQALARAFEQIADGLQRQVDRGRMEARARQDLLARITTIDHLEQLADAGLVIEAIVEDLEIKRQLFRRLESICDQRCLLASNTSSLSITAIAAPLKHPERLLGMHFFNPAPVMKLVEVVSGLRSDPQLARTLLDTATAWGKRAVLTRSTPGFIVNRVARPYYAEGLRLLEEGACTPATLDAILRESGGFRMGPCELMDLIGHDVNYAVTCSVFEAYYQDPRFLPSLVQKELVDGGLLGRKTGQGFFEYGEGARRPQVDNFPPSPAPAAIHIHGELGNAEVLVEAWRQAGITVERSDSDKARIEMGPVTLAPGDGRSATRRAAEEQIPQLVLFDLALDYGEASRITLCKDDNTPNSALSATAGLFQALGKQVSVIDDSPGMVVLRTVCMLANEAADAVQQQVCDAAAADDAMRYGVNYPLGPLAWAERIGLPRVLQVLEHLQQAYGLDRYRPSPLLQRKVLGGNRFHCDSNS